MARRADLVAVEPTGASKICDIIQLHGIAGIKNGCYLTATDKPLAVSS
jgi:hypothetical protein